MSWSVLWVGVLCTQESKAITSDLGYQRSLISRNAFPVCDTTTEHIQMGVEKQFNFLFGSDSKHIFHIKHTPTHKNLNLFTQYIHSLFQVTCRQIPGSAISLLRGAWLPSSQSHTEHNTEDAENHRLRR